MDTDLLSRWNRDNIDLQLEGFRLVRRTMRDEPELAATAFGIDSKIALVLSRLSREQIHHICESVGTLFGPVTNAEWSSALELSRGNSDIRSPLTGSPMANEAQDLQVAFWTLCRELFRHEPLVAAGRYNITDRTIVDELATLSLRSIRRLATSGRALFLNASHAFRVFARLVDLGADDRKQRVMTAAITSYVPRTPIAMSGVSAS